MNLIKKIQYTLDKNFPLRCVHEHDNIFVHFLSDRNYSDSSSSADSKCKSIRELCEQKPCNLRVCPQKPKTSCNLDKVKCTVRKENQSLIYMNAKAPDNEKIDYSLIKCPPLTVLPPDPCPNTKKHIEPEEPLREHFVLPRSQSLPRPPSKPVILCHCIPPPKLPPDDCPCPPEPEHTIPPTRRKIMCHARRKDIIICQFK